MLLPKESMTDVFLTEDSFIAVSQPDEECLNCEATSVAIVTFSAARARVIAAELIRLADQIDDHESLAGVCEPWPVDDSTAASRL